VASAETGDALPFTEEDVVEEEAPARVTFIDYLKSPIVELIIGKKEEATILTAHQYLLLQSPFFKDACSQFGDNSEVSLKVIRIYVNLSLC